MADLSRNGSTLLKPDDDRNGHGVRFRCHLALDLASPSGKRTRISSLSDLALQDMSQPFIRTDEGDKTALLTPTPTQFLFPKHVTEEQEAYAHGFERALEEIYKEKGPPVAVAVSSASADTYTDDQDPSQSDVKTSNVTCISSSSSTDLQNGGPLRTLIPFSQCISQASFSNTSFANPSVVPNDLSSNSNGSSLNFNFGLPDGNPRNGSMQVQSGGAGNQQHFPQDKKVALSEPLSYNCSMNFGQSRPVLFQPSQTLSSTSFQSLGRGHEVSVMSMGQPTAVNSCTRSWTVAEEPNVPVSEKLLSLDCGAFPTPSQSGFHKFDIQRTQNTGSQSNAFLPQPLNSSVPVSIFCQMTGDQSTSLSWSGMSLAEPGASGQQWLPAKREITPVGAVDMDEQERMKLERKRAKNRVAAQRCQMRKLERKTRLEEKAEKLRDQNSKLLQTVDALRKHITQLKTQITAHATKGCRLMLPDVSSSATPVVSSL